MPAADGRPLRNLVVVENSLINVLVRQPTFRKAFPHLAAMVTIKDDGDCRPCTRKKQSATLAEYRDFKNGVASLSPRDKIRFKAYLDTNKARVVHVTAANKVIERTF
jgi:hypothetical protein